MDLAYCGTPWRGWQAQADGTGIQNQVEAAVQRLIKQPVRVDAASRTDAGVHALQQVAHVDVPVESRLSGQAWRDGLNAILPESIRVIAIEPTADDFHASLSCIGKIYRYRIWRSREMNAFEAERAWHVHGPLDLDAMRACAEAFVGRHNFVRLSSNRGDLPEVERRSDIHGHTRTLSRAEIRDHETVMEVVFEGDAFLYHMVRLMTGALMQVGRGRADVAWFEELLASPEGPQNQVMAPAGGLYLAKVIYP
jgi:tRNA pseudouridine38-40 synthase